MEASVTRSKYWTWLCTTTLLAGCAQAGSVREPLGSGRDTAAEAGLGAARDADADTPDAGDKVDSARGTGRPAVADAGDDASAEAGHGGSTDAGEDASEDAGAVDAAEVAATDAVAATDTGADTDASPDTPDDAAATNGCVPGTYAGAFQGKLAYLGFPLFDISGEIEIEALTSDAGNELRIENGSIKGADEDGNPVYAEVHGVMDCTSYELKDGTLTNGTYVRVAYDMTVNFVGEIQATYRPGPTPSVTGRWQADGGSETGSGTFAATLVKAAH